VFFQLVLRTNVVRAGDGFYIDDITFDNLTSVQEMPDRFVAMSPQPAQSFINVGLQSNQEVQTVTITSLAGERLPVSYQQINETLVVDVQGIAVGTHVLEVWQGASRISAMIQILR
jgi:hypothetical protein